jgi:hypothetical protein
MKNAILGLLVMFTVSQAHAGFPGFVNRGRPVVVPQLLRVAQMTDIQVDPNLELGNVVGALTSVDPAGKATLSLTVNNCPPKAMCLVGPMTFNIELPIISDVVDSCGVNVITAEKDQRPVDGMLKRITIRDNSKVTCESIAPLMPTEVVYETESPGFGAPVVHTTSTFAGSVLAPLM